MKARTSKFSKTIKTELVLPNDTNALGNLFGGKLMQWMDVAGGICASRHSEALTVTASVDNIGFAKPIVLGDVVVLEAQVSRAWNSSMEIYIEVFKSDITGKNKVKTNHAYFTFVAIDKETHKPVKVPQVIPKTKEQISRYESANRRKEVRLILSKKLKPEDAKEIIDYFGDFNED
jgi:acyl-CoA hydrolase